MIIRIVIVRCFSYLLVLWFLHPKICVTVSVNIIVKKMTMHSLSVKSNCYRFGRTSNFLNIILKCVMLNLSLLHHNERKVDCAQLHFVRHLKRTWWPFFTCSYWRFNFCFLTVLTMVLQFCNWFLQTCLFYSICLCPEIYLSKTEPHACSLRRKMMRNCHIVSI